MARGQQDASLGSEYNDKLEDMTLLEDEVKLPEESGVEYKCIFRVPPKIRNTNSDAYTPSIYAIGPLHGRPQSGGVHTLSDSEKLKRQYYMAFRGRFKISKEALISTVKKREQEIRSCYDETIGYDSDQLVKLIIIDACFVLECFIRFHQLPKLNKTDPIFSSTWKETYLWSDLSLSENQIPLFVYEDIYDLTPMSWNITFLQLCFKYFKPYNIQEKQPEDVDPAHFVDLQRQFMLPRSTPVVQDRKKGGVPRLYSATELVEAGLKFKPSQSRCWLDIQFQKGKHWYSSSVLTIPELFIDDCTEEFVRNVIAFEQCYCPFQPCIAEYFAILNSLIQSENDVKVLIANHIVSDSNWDPRAVVKMVKNLNLHIIIPDIKPEYADLCDDLIAFKENAVNKFKAKLINEHFGTPWGAVYSIGTTVLFLVGLYHSVLPFISWIKMYL